MGQKMGVNATTLFALWRKHRPDQVICRIFHKYQPGKGWRGWYAERGDECEFLGESYGEAAQFIMAETNSTDSPA